jgi:hypothetical protein
MPRAVRALGVWGEASGVGRAEAARARRLARMREDFMVRSDEAAGNVRGLGRQGWLESVESLFLAMRSVGGAAWSGFGRD